MGTFARGGWFALGFTIGLIAASAVAVYGFGQFERRMGPPDVTFQIVAWLSPVWALVLAIPYMIGTRVWSRAPSARACVAAGIAIGLLFWPAASVGQFISTPYAVALVAIVVVGGSFCAARFGSPASTT